MATLKLKYIYTFYSFGEIMADDVVEQSVAVGEGCRFALKYQEGGSFSVSEVREDFMGRFVVLTYPSKESVIVHEGQTVELSFDECCGEMGDDDHNVYEGTATLAI